MTRGLWTKLPSVMLLYLDTVVSWELILKHWQYFNISKRSFIFIQIASKVCILAKNESFYSIEFSFKIPSENGSQHATKQILSWSLCLERLCTVMLNKVFLEETLCSEKCLRRDTADAICRLICQIFRLCWHTPLT